MIVIPQRKFHKIIILHIIHFVLDVTRVIFFKHNGDIIPLYLQCKNHYVSPMGVCKYFHIAIEANIMSVEIDIVKGLKAGHEGAYKYLYENHYKPLCAVAYAYVKDTLVTEMIVSDVIFAIWQNRTLLEINTSLRNYLVKSVRNRCLNYLAQSERQYFLRSRVGEKIDMEQSDYENSPDNPLSQMIEKELDVKINDCIEALPEQTRRIFCLSRFNDLKYDEIARETGVSVDVVKYHIKSALARLRAGLKDYLTVMLILLLMLQR